VSAQVQDPAHSWNVRFHLNGQDVTRQLTQPGGLVFVGGLRLWPGQSRQVQVTFAPRHSALARRSALPAIRLSLRPNGSGEAQVSQGITLRPGTNRPASVVASARPQGAHGLRAAFPGPLMQAGEGLLPASARP